MCWRFALARPGHRDARIDRHGLGPRAARRIRVVVGMTLPRRRHAGRWPVRRGGARGSAGAATQAWPGAACSSPRRRWRWSAPSWRRDAGPLLRHPALVAAAAVLVSLAALMPLAGHNAADPRAAGLAAACVSPPAAVATPPGSSAPSAFSSPGRWPPGPPFAGAERLLKRAGVVAGRPERRPRHGIPQSARFAALRAPASPWPARRAARGNLGIRDKGNADPRRPAGLRRTRRSIPRSLMQGDFMRLNFNVPGEPAEQRSGMLRDAATRAVASRRTRRGAPRAASPAASRCSRRGCIELTPSRALDPRQRCLVLRRGRGAALGPHGEFRVDAQGHALLVGPYRGPDLASLVNTRPGNAA